MAQKTLGINASNSYVLINDEATQAEIKTKLKTLARKVQEGDSIYFYYNGHGVPIPSQKMNQVKFIFDHQSIRRELNSHIQDLIDEHNWNNLPEEELILKINDEMGDPIDLGKSLNQVHKPLLGYAWIISKSIFVIVLFASALNFISLVDRTAYQKPNIMNTIMKLCRLRWMSCWHIAIVVRISSRFR